MRFLSFFGLFLRPSRQPMDIRLVGRKVVLRAAEPMDWHEWRALRESSSDFLRPWEPEWPKNGLGYGFFCGMLRRQWREWRQDKAYAFLIFLRKGEGIGPLAGGITLSDVQRGIGQKATLGYWIGRPYAGQGLMTEAAGLICDFAFDALKLHRLEANCLPHNEPSIRLLRRFGFREEGRAQSYLQINGVWQDHLLWGKTKL